MNNRVGWCSVGGREDEHGRSRCYWHGWTGAWRRETGGSSGLHDATAPYRLGLSFCTRNDFEMKPVSLVCDVLLLKASRLSLMYVK